MIWLLQRLFFGHVHKWKIITQAPMTSGWDAKNRILGIRYTVQCEKCGAIKHKDAF